MNHVLKIALAGLVVLGLAGCSSHRHEKVPIVPHRTQAQKQAQAKEMAEQLKSDKAALRVEEQETAGDWRHYPSDTGAK